MNRRYTMKKISTVLLAASFAMLSATVFACPKGTELQGGTGPHHKGGKCVAVSGKKMAAKTDKKMMAEKSKPMTTAMPAKTEPKNQILINTLNIKKRDQLAFLFISFIASDLYYPMQD